MSGSKNDVLEESNRIHKSIGRPANIPDEKGRPAASDHEASAADLLSRSWGQANATRCGNLEREAAHTAGKARYPPSVVL